MQYLKNTLVALLTTFTISATAQTTVSEMLAHPEKTAGVYLTYPTTFAPQTPAPRGYTPFYISHYGRHGSRFLLSDKDTKSVLDIFSAAHDSSALTPLGEDVLHRLEIVWDEAEGHGGDLSPLGVRQHQGIAERMASSFPEVFEGKNKNISARSTLVMRCTMSMIAFGDKLKGLYPSLNISYDASHKYLYYMTPHNPNARRQPLSPTSASVKEEAQNFKDAHISPARLVATLFSDTAYVSAHINSRDVMTGLYWIASDMQNVDCGQNFYDLFTPEELFNLWQCFNYDFYAGSANPAGGKSSVVTSANDLLLNIIQCADSAINTGYECATLRFGHDSNIIPLAALMGIENCRYEETCPDSLFLHWNTFHVSPMGANLQFIFFRNKKDANDILVKVLHNETEVHIPAPTNNWPYYSWQDFKTYYLKVLDGKE